MSAAASKVEQLVVEPHQMSSPHQVGLVEEDDEYEYAVPCTTTRANGSLTGYFSTATRDSRLTSLWQPTWLPARLLVLRYVIQGVVDCRGTRLMDFTGALGDVPH